MIFDQYSRYKACSDLLHQAGIAPSDSVLDIGSGPECLFGQFMPDAEMTYVDPLIPGDSEQGHITGNVFASELDGQSFDCVTAVDVLEHVPPEQRPMFLERMSSLSKNALVLGFPSSDSSDALETDKAIDDQYRAIYGHDYSWLEEHFRYGLPSLAETVEQLTQMGWHCQTVGHGHAPWIRELLGFVICAWDIPSMRDVVLAISEKFNRELYPHDFCPPYYRQFLIASRRPLPHIGAPVTSYGIEAADNAFRALMKDANRQYFHASARQLAERDALVNILNTKIDEVSTWGKTQQIALAERDALVGVLNTKIDEVSTWGKTQQIALAERDALAAELALMKQSRTWRLMHFVSVMQWIIKHRTISDYDRACIKDGLRRCHHKLPHPLRQLVQWGYFKIFGDPSRVTPRRVQSTVQFQQPVVHLSRQTAGLPDYIVWGVIDWHFRIQRPQHLARELAAAGRRVFYVSAELIDDGRAGFEVEPLDSEGRLFQVKLYVSTAPRIYYAAPGIDNVRRMRASIGEVLQWADSKNLVSFVQHAYWVDVAKALPNSRMVYDCMDHHEGFGDVSVELLALERSLLQDADLTVTTSDYLNHIVASQTEKSVLIRNAGEFEHFATRPTAVYRDQQDRKVIGYYGAIAEWFDQDLVEAIATRFSQCRILLVGADSANAKDRLGRLPNVEFVGEVPYVKLPYYLYGFDVCLLPFKIIPLTLATNPVKVYEYLSSGKPVVTVDLPEMKQFGDLVKVADSTFDFLAAIDAALSLREDPTTINNRRTFAKEQTWKHRVAALISYVESMADEPKVSVVVVTYNNLDFTKACLASLDKCTDYSPMEIIVVDNASSDGSKEFLTEWVATAPNRELILNEDNRGFAAANNQGLAIATGNYLVLLNNDTYVTPGWVRTLIKHLQRDKTIGLIGPVTNNIGNQAKIDIHYNNMDEMLQRSAVYTRQHIGQTYPLSTAAFFCVLMPRSVYEQVGPLDEVYGRGFFEDDDYCRRIEQIGMRVVCAEDVFVHHHLSASFNKLKQQDRQKLFEDNRKIYEIKWGEWVPHESRKNQNFLAVSRSHPTVFSGQQNISGHCNVCGKPTHFFYQNVALWRESLNCEHCRTTSRYRSITQGVLRAITELTGTQVPSLARLPHVSHKKLRVYDTQPPFYYEPCAYPLPDLLKATGWIDVWLSQYKPKLKMGAVLAEGITNQNLECLTFDDESLDIVITSDVMEHVRLDDRAHREIYRVLKPGGIYVFTVPHNRAWDETLIRVQITNPDDPSKDVHLLEPEYHGDTNSDEDGGVLAYRAYGKDIEVQLTKLGFEVEYTREAIESFGILNTELYYCRKISQ